MAGISRRSKTLYWLDLPKFDSPLNLQEVPFEDATCLKIGSRWKVFRKSGRKKGVKGGSLRGNSSIVSIQLDKFDPK